MAIKKTEQREIWNEVDKILWNDWDPIGVNDYGGSHDEYRGYVPSILKLLQDGADVYKIAMQLHHHAKVNMGLTSEIESHKKVAAQLRKLIS